MEEIIKVSDYCETALSVEDGERIQNKINELLEKEIKIVLDFEKIELYATPFFNVAIGHFVSKITPEVLKEKIKCINLSELGEETYRYSYENAKLVYQNKLTKETKEKITDIIESNITNS